MHFLDCVTGKVIEINDQQYFQFENDLVIVPFQKHATQFMVLNIEKEEKDRKSINASIGGYKYQISRVKKNINRKYIIYFFYFIVGSCSNVRLENLQC